MFGDTRDDTRDDSAFGAPGQAPGAAMHLGSLSMPPSGAAEGGTARTVDELPLPVRAGRPPR